MARIDARLAALERVAKAPQGIIIVQRDERGRFWRDGHQAEDVAPILLVRPGMLETLCSVGGSDAN